MDKLARTGGDPDKAGPAVKEIKDYREMLMRKYTLDEAELDHILNTSPSRLRKELQ